MNRQEKKREDGEMKDKEKERSKRNRDQRGLHEKYIRPFVSNPVECIAYERYA